MAISTDTLEHRVIYVLRIHILQKSKYVPFRSFIIGFVDQSDSQVPSQSIDLNQRCSYRARNLPLLLASFHSQSDTPSSYPCFFCGTGYALLLNYWIATGLIQILDHTSHSCQDVLETGTARPMPVMYMMLRVQQILLSKIPLSMCRPIIVFRIRWYR